MCGVFLAPLQSRNGTRINPVSGTVVVTHPNCTPNTVSPTATMHSPALRSAKARAKGEAKIKPGKATRLFSGDIVTFGNAQVSTEVAVEAVCVADACWLFVGLLLQFLFEVLTGEWQWPHCGVCVVCAVAHLLACVGSWFGRAEEEAADAKEALAAADGGPSDPQQLSERTEGTEDVDSDAATIVGSDTETEVGTMHYIASNRGTHTHGTHMHGTGITATRKCKCKCWGCCRCCR